jgi:hypothetical protein
VTDAVEQQLRAYNAHDVDEFVGCYATDVVVEDSDGEQLLSGHDQLRARYAQLFADSPDLRAEVVTRIQVGPFVVDEERVTSGPRGDVHAVAIYRLNADGLIDRVRFLR